MSVSSVDSKNYRGLWKYCFFQQKLQDPCDSKTKKYTLYLAIEFSMDLAGETLNLLGTLLFLCEVISVYEDSPDKKSLETRPHAHRGPSPIYI